MADCSKCGFVMDERTRPPRCPRCGTPTGAQAPAPPFAPPTTSSPTGRGRTLEPVGAPPVFGGAAPGPGTTSGHTLYGLPVPDENELLTLLGDDPPSPGSSSSMSSGPPPVGESESSGQFDAGDLFDNASYGEVELGIPPDDDALELDLPGMSAPPRAVKAPTSSGLPVIDDDEPPGLRAPAIDMRTTQHGIPTRAPSGPAPAITPPPAARPGGAPPPGSGAPRPPVGSAHAPRTTGDALNVPRPVPPPRPPIAPSVPPAMQGAPPLDLPMPARRSGDDGFGPAPIDLPTPARPAGGGFGPELPVPARPGQGTTGTFSKAGGPPPSPPAFGGPGGPGGPLPRTIETPKAPPPPRGPQPAPRMPGFDDEMISVADLDLPAPVDLDLPMPAGVDLPTPAGVDFPMPAGVDLLAPASLEVEPAQILPAPATQDLRPAANELQPTASELQARRGPHVPVPRAIGSNVATAMENDAAPSTAFDPLGARRSPTPRDVSTGSGRRPLIIALVGIGLLAAAAGGAYLMGVFDPPLDVEPQSTKAGAPKKKSGGPVAPATVASERTADVLVLFAKHTPKDYVDAIAAAEATGDRVGQAEAALRLHLRYGPDQVRGGQAHAWLEPYAAQPDPFVQRVVGLAALAKPDLAKAEAALVGDDSLVRLYRGWLRMAQDRPTDAIAEAQAILTVAPGDVAAIALLHEARAKTDPDAELAAIETSLGTHAGHPALTMIAVRTAIAAGHLRKARAWLDSLGTPAGTSQGYAARVLKLRGDLDGASGAPGKAAQRYAEALALASDDPTVAPARVHALLKAKRIADAESDAAAIVKARPNDVDALLLQAEVAVEAGEGDKALTLLQTIETQAPGRADAAYLTGLVHAMRVEVDQGKKAFATALERDQTHDVARMAEARMLADSGRVPEAITALDGARKLVAVRPGGAPRVQAEMLRVKAQLLTKAGQTAAALAALDQALELHPTANDAQLARGLLRLDQGQYADGKADLLAVYARTGNYAGLTAPLGRIFVREGALKELEALVGDVLDDAEATSEELIVGARLRLLQGKPDEARTLAQRVLSVEPNNWEAHLVLAQALLEAADYGEALAEIERSTPPTPNAEQHLWRGKILAFNTRHPEARQEYLKALQIDPELHEARFMYGELLSHSEGKAAEVELKKVVEATKDRYPQAWVALARAQRDMGEFDEAMKSASKALALDDKLYEAHYLKGRVHFERNAIGSAIGDLEKATDESMKTQQWYADALLFLGKSYERQGKNAEAKAAWKRVIELDPKGARRDEAERLVAGAK